MNNILENRLLYQRFIENMNQVCNGVTFICSFAYNPETTITESLTSFLFDGEFTKQIFLLDQASHLFNYANFDTDLETFVYPEIKNYFVKEPLELEVSTISHEEMVALYIGFLTSTKSPYQKQLNRNKASEIVHEFFHLLLKKAVKADPHYYMVEPNFLLARGDSMLTSGSHYMPYFDQWYFDSCTLLKVKHLVYMILTNGFP